MKSQPSRQPYRAAFCAIVLALTVACSQGEDAGLGVDVNVKVDVQNEQATLDAAMQADRDFSALAQTTSMSEAFGAYMDAVDGKIISPGSVLTGSEAIKAAFRDWPADLKMTWAPDMGHGAKSGDLAVTSGRWVRTRDGKTVAEGRYVTVWRKNDKGEWKGVIDVGNPDPPPAPPPDPEGRPG